MLDLKAVGSECHQQLTGRDNQQIKRSICLLAERGKLAELRLLVIPGQVDYLQHIEELAALIKGTWRCSGTPERVSCPRRVWRGAKLAERHAGGCGTTG